jgi:hypothetical protein
LVIASLPQIHLFHPIQSFKESAPELMPGKLSVRDGMEPAFSLHSDDILDSGLLDGDEGLGRGCLVCKDGVSVLQQGFRSEERTDVFGAEGRVALCGDGWHVGHVTR